MKDISRLQVYAPGVLRQARRIISLGFTVEDIDAFLGYMKAKQHYENKDRET